MKMVFLLLTALMLGAMPVRSADNVDWDFNRRLTDLERRVDNIEGRLGITTKASAAVAAAPVAVAPAPTMVRVTRTVCNGLTCYPVEEWVPAASAGAAIAAAPFASTTVGVGGSTVWATGAVTTYSDVVPDVGSPVVAAPVRRGPIRRLLFGR